MGLQRPALSLHSLRLGRDRSSGHDTTGQARLEAEAARRAAEHAELERRLDVAAAESLRRQGRLQQFRAAVGWCA